SLAINAIPVADEILRDGSPAVSFSQLQSNPLGGWVVGHPQPEKPLVAVAQSGSFAGAIALERLASCGLRSDGALSPRGANELVEFIASLLDFTDDAGPPAG